MQFVRRPKRTSTDLAAAHYVRCVVSTGGKGAVAVAEVLTTARSKTRKGRKSSKGDAVGLLDDTQETNFGI